MKQLLGGAQDWGEPWELWCLAVPLDEPGAMISFFTKKSRSLVASIWKPLPREDARGRLENSLGDLEEKQPEEQRGGWGLQQQNLDMGKKSANKEGYGT